MAFIRCCLCMTGCNRGPIYYKVCEKDKYLNFNKLGLIVAKHDPRVEQRLFALAGQRLIRPASTKHWLDKICYGAIYSYFFLKKYFKIHLSETSLKGICLSMGLGRVLTTGKVEHILSKSGSEGSYYESHRCTSDY